MSFRIGQGFDVHAFGAGDHVMLAGVRIPHEHGLTAHSDGDVAIHALCDSLLGALALGDIGQHFPPADNRWRDADSCTLLASVNEMINGLGWKLVNADLTIACESPRVGPHVRDMRATLATVLDVSPDAISIKATTTERLGFCGREEGIAALAVALIQEQE
jgi:2-C-methyl-D-erythritol 2,4-cyclodiphosphate synthase